MTSPTSPRRRARATSSDFGDLVTVVAVGAVLLVFASIWLTLVIALGVLWALQLTGLGS